MDSWSQFTSAQGGVSSISEGVLLMRNEDMPAISWVLTVRLPQRTVYPKGCFPRNNIWAITDTVKTKTWEDLGKTLGFLLPAWVWPSSPEKLVRGWQYNVQTECEGERWTNLPCPFQAMRNSSKDLCRTHSCSWLSQLRCHRGTQWKTISDPID